MSDIHTILIVEDNQDDMFLMRRALKNEGILNPVVIVDDGQKGIDYLEGVGIYADRTKFPFPELIFLDLQLPHKSGFDVLERLRESGLKRPVVVVLSSSNSPYDMERCSELGASHYAVKPPDGSLFQKIEADFGIRWKKAVPAPDRREVKQRQSTDRP